MTVSAIIPIRYSDCIDQDGAPRFELAGRPLWEITLSQALDSEKLQGVIVAYDDERFLPHLENYGENIKRCLRPKRLSEPDATILGVLAFAAKTAEEDGYRSDYYLLMEITHPLRPKGIVNQMIDALAEFDADSLITCKRSHYSHWRKASDGSVRRIGGAGDSDGIEMFQELSGICSVFQSASLLTDNPFGEKIDIVPIDKYWATIDVRDVDGLWLAEQYLERLGIDI